MSMSVSRCETAMDYTYNFLYSPYRKQYEKPQVVSYAQKLNASNHRSSEHQSTLLKVFFCNVNAAE